MKCRKVQNRILDLLPLSLEESLPVDILEHLSVCPECRSYYQEHEQAIQRIIPTISAPFPKEFNDQLMQRIRSEESKKTLSTVAHSRKASIWKPVYVTCLAILILTSFVFFNPNEWIQHIFRNNSKLPADVRLFNAFANEFSYSHHTGMLYQSSEVIFLPLTAFLGEEEQWYPITVINESGQIEIVKIGFKENHRKKRIIKDESWYDLDSSRFVRMLSIDQKVIFLNAFDGRQLFTTQKNSNNRGFSVERYTPVEFKIPQPEEFFGFAASLPALFADSKEVKMVNSISKKQIAGEPIQQIKTTVRKKDGSAYRYFFNITPSNNEVAEIHTFLYRTPLLTIIPNIIKSDDTPSFPYNFPKMPFDDNRANGIKIETSESPPLLKRITFAEMRENVWNDYLYIESSSVNPQLIEYSDMFDFGYPSKRVYLTTYYLPDGNPVILAQSYSLNMRYGRKIKDASQLIYSTKEGLKVWENRMTHIAAKQLAQFALSINEKPSNDDITGYLLEHPNGGFAYVVSNKKINSKLFRFLGCISPLKK